ncbi:unnamed protein product [marine sediment metagenome]|uniref:Uncharacterized protein n=1 Tax=marine sediment metagenome TaxID=412755 RepID=X1IN09_9ZZZZ
MPSVYVDGLPTSLSCFCLATKSSGYDRIAESFRLFWQPGPRHWRGASAESGRNVEAIVTVRPGENNYELEVNVRDGQAVIGHYAWDNVGIKPGPPWDSGLLRRPPGPAVPGFELHVLN